VQLRGFDRERMTFPDQSDRTSTLQKFQSRVQLLQKLQRTAKQQLPSTAFELHHHTEYHRAERKTFSALDVVIRDTARNIPEASRLHQRNNRPRPRRHQRQRPPSTLKAITPRSIEAVCKDQFGSCRDDSRRIAEGFRSDNATETEQQIFTRATGSPMPLRASGWSRKSSG